MRSRAPSGAAEAARIPSRIRSRSRAPLNLHTRRPAARIPEQAARILSRAGRAGSPPSRPKTPAETKPGDDVITAGFSPMYPAGPEFSRPCGGCPRRSPDRRGPGRHSARARPPAARSDADLEMRARHPAPSGPSRPSERQPRAVTGRLTLGGRRGPALGPPCHRNPRPRP